jgi:CO/xanthine dehydrogenase Mo-binding subunit
MIVNRGHPKTPPRHEAKRRCCQFNLAASPACAAEVSIENKRPRIHRVVVALDCGIAVNPLSKLTGKRYRSLPLATVWSKCT